MAAYVYEPEGRPDKNLLEQYIFSSCSETSKATQVKKLAAKKKQKGK